ECAMPEQKSLLIVQAPVRVQVSDCLPRGMSVGRGYADIVQPTAILVQFGISEIEDVPAHAYQRWPDWRLADHFARDNRALAIPAAALVDPGAQEAQRSIGPRLAGIGG